MPFDALVTIEENRRLDDKAFVVTFRSPMLAAEVLPGQFVMLGFPGTSEPLLRRPYSVYRVGRPGHPSDLCEVQYKVIGRGTARLAGLRRGEPLTCLGPLGRGFHLPSRETTPLLVAGGIGIAGLLHLGAALVDAGHRPKLLFGCRNQEDLPLLEGFEALGVPIQTATEDGSHGLHGRVTGLLEPEITAGACEVFTCGPEPMLKAVARMTTGKVACQVAMESAMACGFGVCLGCVVPAAGGTGYGRYVRVCVEGPVFPAQELEW